MSSTEAPSRTLIRRSARAVYDPARWPGRVIWPALRKLPGLLTPRLGRRYFQGLGTTKLVVLSVYRKRNAALLRALLVDCPTAGAEIRLWALDGIASDLAQWTVGSGPGLRCDLLNRLWSTVEPSSAQWVIICDDDVELLNGWTIPAVIGAMAGLRVDFAQPAHAPGSISSHGFNLRRPLIAGRRVAAVEIGPIVLVRSPWVRSILPFPEDAGMGFYLEWEWSRLIDQGCQAAVLDAVPMRHLGAISTEYGPEVAGSRRYLEGSRASSLDELNELFAEYGRILWPSSCRRRGSGVSRLGPLS